MLLNVLCSLSACTPQAPGLWSRLTNQWVESKVVCRSARPGLTYERWDAHSIGDILLDVATAPQGGPNQTLYQVAQSAILAAVEVTPCQARRLRGAAQLLPDGTYNPAWLAARRWRLTSSKFEAVRRVGRHRQLADSLLNGWWYRGEGYNHKAKRARQFESQALVRYAERLARQAGKEQCSVASIGTLVDPDVPWLAASPDGIVLAADGSPSQLIEVKSHSVAMCSRAPVWAQVQGSMAIASGCFGRPVHRCKVVTPDETFAVNFDKPWWQRRLQRLHGFYFQTFLPLAAQQVVDRFFSLDST